MQFIRLTTVLAAVLFVAACLPVTSRNPVGSTQGLGADPGLTGTWKVKSDQASHTSTSWIHFIPAKDGSFSIIMADAGTPGKTDGEWQHYKGRSVRLGENRFLNVNTVSDNGMPDKSRIARDHVVLLYRYTSPASVSFYAGDDRKLAAAIAAKKIAGIVEPGDNGDVILTASPAQLDKYLQTKEGVALFSKPFVVLTKAN